MSAIMCSTAFARSSTTGRSASASSRSQRWQTVPDLHPATRGFEAADRYERGRPDYPAAAVTQIVVVLDLRPRRHVLDLAAGAGKLPRLLAPSGANVIALEPVHEMRAEL